MSNKIRLLQFLFLVVVSVLLVYVFRDDIWSQSVDLAHHYSLVVRLTEFGHLPSAVDLSLGEMEMYPSLGHRLAVIAGRLFGSPLVGMQMVVLLSMFALWASIGWILWSLPRRAARRTVLLLLALLLANWLTVRAELFDRELVGNYFYSQFLGQALATLTIAAALRLSQVGISRFAIYIFLIVSMLTVESVHLLPAVELLGFLGLLVTIDQYPAANRRRHSAVVASFGLFLLAALAVIKHPTFRAMRTISENNGTLPLHYIPNLPVLIGLALVIVALSIALILTWLRLDRVGKGGINLAVKYFGLFGLAVAILCLLQIVALAFGQGSEYACRKYAFALCSVLLVDIALLPVAFTSSDDSSDGTEHFPQMARVFDVCAIGILVLVSFLTSIPAQKEYSLAKLVSLERRLNLLNTSSVSHEAGKANYVVRLPGLSPMIDYMFSIGIFKAPRTDNAYDVLYNRVLSQPDQVGNIITAHGAKPYDIAACRRPSSDAILSVVDGPCFTKMIPRRTSCDGWFHLTPDNWLDSSVLHGFGSPEAQGTWTEGAEATFSCKMPDSAEARPKMIRIVVQGFVAHDHVQRLAISLNNGAPSEYQFRKEGAQQVIDLAIPSDASDLQVKFSTPDAISPDALGVAHDLRKLGVYVSWIQFSTSTSFQ